MDSIEGLATVSGCVRLLDRTYFQIYRAIKRKELAPIRITGSTALFYRVSEVAASLKNSK